MTKRNSPAPAALDDTRLEQIYSQIANLLRELNPELTDAEVEAALARVLFYAEREHQYQRPRHA